MSERKEIVESIGTILQNAEEHLGKDFPGADIKIRLGTEGKITVSFVEKNVGDEERIRERLRAILGGK